LFFSRPKLPFNTLSHWWVEVSTPQTSSVRFVLSVTDGQAERTNYLAYMGMGMEECTDAG